jgi:hypothetical protein
MDYKKVIQEAEKTGTFSLTVRLSIDTWREMKKIVNKEKRNGKKITLNSLIGAICKTFVDSLK